MFSIENFTVFWDSLFFDKINYPALGLLRILIGIICLLKIYLLLYSRYDYFGVNGYYPYKSWENDYKKNNYFSIFHYLKTNDFSVDLVLFLGIVFSFLLTIGFCTGLSCFINYILFVSIHHRNVYICNSGDCLLRIILFFLIFSGCGCYMSIDNIIYDRKQLEFYLSPLFIRLIQIVLINVYFHSFCAKLNNSDLWIKGTGLFYSLNNKSVNRYNITKYLNKYLLLFLNYSILAAESLLVLGLFFEETSTICAFLLILMHLFFEFFLRINLFGIVMIACLVLFLNDYIVKCC